MLICNIIHDKNIVEFVFKMYWNFKLIKSINEFLLNTPSLNSNEKLQSDLLRLKDLGFASVSWRCYKTLWSLKRVTVMLYIVQTESCFMDVKKLIHDIF